MVQDIKNVSGAGGNDRMRLSIDHPSLKMGILIPFSDVSTLSGQEILDEMEKVIQSNEDFHINDGQMSIEETHTQLPSGSGKRNVLNYGLYFDSQNLRKNEEKYD